MDFKKTASVLLALFLLLTVLPVRAAAQSPWAARIPEMLAAGDYIDGEVVVGVKAERAEGFDLAALLGLRESLDGEELMRVSTGSASGGTVLTVLRDPDRTTEELLCALSGDGRVVFAEPNYLLAPTSTDASAAVRGAVTVLQAAETEPAADLTPFQWGAYKANIPNFGPEGGNMEGEPIVVAVMDFAVDFSHPDLASKAYSFTPEQQAELGCDEHGYNATGISSDGKLNLRPGLGHGTMCAGVIGAAWDGSGISGAASNVQLVSVQIGDYDEGYTPLGAALRGYDFIKRANEAGADIRIVNNSWGLYQVSLALDAATRELGETQGVVSIFAAGNDGVDLKQLEDTSGTLADNPYVILVAASNEDDSRSSFSTYSDTMVTLAAPGSGILCCVPVQDAAYFPGAYPDDNLFYEDFEDGEPRVIMSQLDLEANVVAEAAPSDARSMTGESCLELKPDQDNLLNDYFYLLTLDIPATELKADGANYLGFYYWADGFAVVYAYKQYDFEQEEWSDYRDVPYTATTGGQWDRFSMPLPETAFNDGEPLRLCLALYTEDVSVLCLDGVGIGTKTAPYAFQNGTSMAAPLVSGVAAILASENRDLRGAELAELICTKVRQTPSFADITVMGGVLDFNAESAIPQRPETPDPEGTLFEKELPFDDSTGAPYVFDTLGDWETRGPLAGLEGKLYYLPCVTKMELTPACKRLLCFDTQTESWSELPELPEWLAEVSAAVLDGKLVVEGARVDLNVAGEAVQAAEPGERVYVYDPAAASWSEASHEGLCPGLTLVSDSEQLFLVGAADEEEQLLAPVAYDLSTGAEKALESPGITWRNPSAAAGEGVICVFDGLNGRLARFSGEECEILEETVPTASNTMLGAGVDVGAIVRTEGGVILTGWIDAETGADTWLLPDDSTEFTALEQRASLRPAHSVAAAACDGWLYVIGASYQTAQRHFFRATALPTAG